MTIKKKIEEEHEVYYIVTYGCRWKRMPVKLKNIENMMEYMILDMI